MLVQLGFKMKTDFKGKILVLQLTLLWMQWPNVRFVLEWDTWSSVPPEFRRLHLELLQPKMPDFMAAFLKKMWWILQPPKRLGITKIITQYALFVNEEMHPRSIPQRIIPFKSFFFFLFLLSHGDIGRVRWAGGIHAMKMS